MGFGGIPIMSGKDSEFLVRLNNVEYDKSIELIRQAISKGARLSCGAERSGTWISAFTASRGRSAVPDSYRPLLPQCSAPFRVC